MEVGEKIKSLTHIIFITIGFLEIQLSSIAHFMVIFMSWIPEFLIVDNF